jgi:hypothetical protein
MQNYKNHAHWVPSYHFVTIPLMVASLVYCMARALGNGEDKLLFGLLGFTILLLGSVSFHCRSFALKVQDRMVALEENFRHYRLTGSPIHPGLKLEQVIALRFASDDEFPQLCKEALEEKLSNAEIKKRVKTWKPDYRRA